MGHFSKVDPITCSSELLYATLNIFLLFAEVVLWRVACKPAATCEVIGAAPPPINRLPQ